MRKLYTPWIVLPLALVLMAGLMYAAVSADCVRLYESACAEITTIDGERITLEKRYFDLMKRHSPESTEKFSETDRDFHATSERFRAQVAANPTPATPEEKRFRDDVAGVINRWDTVDREYKQAKADLDAYMKSFRGSVAKKYSLHDPLFAP